MINVSIVRMRQTKLGMVSYYLDDNVLRIGNQLHNGFRKLINLDLAEANKSSMAILYTTPLIYFNHTIDSGMLK